MRREDGQLLKLTPLLYELIGAIDGRRGYSEIAAGLSRRLGKRVSADNVRFLVERKLVPLGLIAGDAGPPRLERSNPLLALRPRFVITKPGSDKPHHHPLHLAVSPRGDCAAGRGVRRDHSLADLRQGPRLGAPPSVLRAGLILLIWGLVAASMAFHEIGHAAACRYGGAGRG